MSNIPISIIDTGLGNIGSVSRMIQRVGGEPHLCRNPDSIVPNSKIILPGVGHYDHGIASLLDHGFDYDFWKDIAARGNYILGICLGMQLLCRSSEEGTTKGLGLIEADVKKFRYTQDENLKVPHMGWNIVVPGTNNVLIPQSETEQRFYFVHTYKVVPDNDQIVIGWANYGGTFCAAFKQKNVCGVQFHPEKSHQFGIELFKRFIAL